MTALQTLAQTLRSLPLDDAGREAAEKLCREAEAEQQELVIALNNALLQLDSLWRSEIQGRNGPEHCPYDAYTLGMATLSSFPKG